MIIFKNLKTVRFVKNCHELSATASVTARTKPSVIWDFFIQFFELIKFSLLCANNVRICFINYFRHDRQAIWPGIWFAVAGVPKIKSHDL
ncbi:MAG TPA: hypothetical protein DCP58_01615 [Verrucomicrobiales bacterium]|nr:hypothetical protein [Verrucomicrobiales bacterium]